jgi:S-adenosylmethionine hydrolase
VALIAILTDFGDRDQYVFQMKSVIKRISPNAELLDITHSVPGFDILTGSYLLLQASKYAPEGSILVAVVDPGVGTSRRAIAIRTKDCILLGPDNGLLYETAKLHRILEVREITNPAVVLRRGGTFDGRDVFAPAAAHLLNGLPFRDLGAPVKRIVQLKFPRSSIGREVITGRVLHVDHFGNAVLNITSEDFRHWAGKDDTFNLKVGRRSFRARFSKTYFGSRGLLIVGGSAGLIEISSYRKGAPAGVIYRDVQVKISKV